MASTTSSGDSTLRRVTAAVAEQPRARAVAGALLLTAFGGFVDYVTGPELAPLLFYLVPVTLVAWAGRRPDALVMSFLAAGLWLVMEAARGREYSSNWILGWNALTRLGVLLVVAAAVTSLRRKYFLERHLIREAEGNPKMPCPYCGSKDTLRLTRSLVCRSCQRSAPLTGLGASGA